MFLTKHKKLFIGVSVALMSSTPAFATDLSIGDANSDLGQLTVSGWLRANITDKDYSNDDHKLQFNAAKLNVNYDAKNFYGNLEYRCYQFDTLCDFSSLVNANLGYKINKDNRVTVGVQDVPFGPGRGWSTSWYGGIDVNAGLEDIHNLGINFQSNITKSTKVDLAYFVGDAGNYVGKGYDSSRYTANYVKTNVAGDSSYEEKNMFVGRIDQELPNLNIPDLKLSAGGSYWYSDIDNKTYSATGHRNTWALFTRASYKGLNFTLTGGKNKITNKDPLHPDYSVMGSFDDTYYVANNADFYTADLNYVYKDPNQR
ncbi:hypothetical protein, partial [Acinetobacter sp. MB5]|uniref:hypothetical protein n=1 Tax=Acinetobacter sp. MB5 TaxID=2069438 RepID=UPI000DD07CBF